MTKPKEKKEEIYKNNYLEIKRWTLLSRHREWLSIIHIPFFLLSLSSIQYIYPFLFPHFSLRRMNTCRFSTLYATAHRPALFRPIPHLFLFRFVYFTSAISPFVIWRAALSYFLFYIFLFSLCLHTLYHLIPPWAFSFNVPFSIAGYDWYTVALARIHLLWSRKGSLIPIISDAVKRVS